MAQYHIYPSHTITTGLTFQGLDAGSRTIFAAYEGHAITFQGGFILCIITIMEKSISPESRFSVSICIYDFCCCLTAILAALSVKFNYNKRSTMTVPKKKKKEINLEATESILL